MQTLPERLEASTSRLRDINARHDTTLRIGGHVDVLNA
jgi:hypothetical protein